MSDTANLAVFIDFENLALGFKEKGASARKNAKRQPGQFDVKRVLERLVEKGKIVVKVAYADWAAFPEYREKLHEAGIQLMEIPERRYSGKNFADMQLCVDAMDMCYAKEHVGTFVIVSGDSDFTPLVSKLKENGKTVIGLGMKDSTSDLLAGACDEFIYYEDLAAAPKGLSLNEKVPKSKRPAMKLLLETVEALMRENVEVMQASLVKDTMRRKKPSFSEATYGYRSFQALLEDAQKYGLITLTRDERSGTYAVQGFGGR
ncbi:MAG: hypothetical protein Kow0056_15520 [Coriobacteriia bacterium]